MQIDVSEARRLAADLRSASPRVGRKVAAGFRKSAREVVTLAQATAPHRTGELASSIGADIYGDGRGGSLAAVIGPTAYYGRYVENGTAFMAPEPFMTPALEAVEPSFVKAMEDALAEVLP